MSDHATAERIRGAAEQEFAAHGFAGASIQEIATRAGVNKALVFYHFGSKADLFRLVLDDYYERHARALADGSRRGGTLPERIHLLVDRYLDFVETNAHLVRLVQHELAAGGEHLPRIREGIARLHAAVAAMLREVTEPEGPRSSRQFFVTFAGLATHYYLTSPALAGVVGADPLDIALKRERREHIHFVVDALLAALTVPRPHSADA